MARQTTVIAEGFTFLEGPRWHDGKLWFSDMHDQRVMTIDPNGRIETIVELDDQPSGLGWLPDGRLLVVSMTKRKLLRLDEDGLHELADLSHIATYHANDMVVDSQGRAYVGNFGWDFESDAAAKSAAIALVLPDGTTRVAAEDLLFPNGTVITPDGKTLVVGESFGGRLTAFDIAADGTLINRRTWAPLDGKIPDGCCIDAEGAIWIASPPTKEVVRVREGGDILDRVACDRMAIACMLGGANRRTLYVLTSTSTNREKCLAARSARIETVQVDVPGAGLP